MLLFASSGSVTPGLPDYIPGNIPPGLFLLLLDFLVCQIRSSKYDLGPSRYRLESFYLKLVEANALDTNSSGIPKIDLDLFLIFALKSSFCTFPPSLSDFSN